MSFPVLTGSEGAKWEMTLRGDSQSANISAHKVRLHVIIYFATYMYRQFVLDDKMDVR